MGELESLTCAALNGRDLRLTEEIQSLWGGYGRLLRYQVIDGDYPSVVVKHVRFPVHCVKKAKTSLDHRRKERSYQVEMTWYEKWASRCEGHCRVPKCLFKAKKGDESWLVLEDLDSVGFSRRCVSASLVEVKACLSWLANFHAIFMDLRPEGLWKVGTYWHLETRTEELKALDDLELRKNASILDHMLRASPFQTWVHGDAKLANFCFSRKGDQVAAVDFQYVGGGCGMKDVAYLIDSCYTEDAAERMEGELLDWYFLRLRSALSELGRGLDCDALEANWRMLYPVAWTDFHRFLKGWSPGRWNPQGYSEKTALAVLSALKGKNIE